MMDKFLKVMLTMLICIGLFLVGFSVYFWFTPKTYEDLLFQINVLTLSMGILYLAFTAFIFRISKIKK